MTYLKLTDSSVGSNAVIEGRISIGDCLRSTLT